MSCCCCCAAPNLCISCANLQTLGSTSHSTCGGTRNIDVSGYTVPALNGLCISVCAKLAVLGTGTAGVVIGLGPAMFGRNVGSPNYGQQTLDLVTGCPDGTSVFSTFGAFAANDIITLRVEDTSGGAGTYQVKCYINGTLAKTTTGISYSFVAGNTIQIGSMNTGTGSSITLLEIATS